MADEERHDGPLAEFAALRAEILQLNQQQSQVLTLQLTISGAVLSVAISRDSLRALMLVIPLVSYLLYFRFLAGSMSIYEIARYVREELSERVPGGLHWEDWLRRESRQMPIFGIVPRLLTFPGASLIALGWSFATIFLSSGMNAGERTGMATLWFLGFGGAGHLVYIISYGYYRNVKLSGGRRNADKSPP